MLSLTLVKGSEINQNQIQHFRTIVLNHRGEK
jgi:hypothetical protein